MVVVYAVSGGHREAFAHFKMERDAIEFCNSMHWKYEDPNGYVWTLEF